MSKPRITTNEQDQALADWYWDLKHMGTVRSKAKELGISVCALYAAIARGLGKPTAGERFKLAEYQRSAVADVAADVPRGTSVYAEPQSTHSVVIELATDVTKEVA